MTAEITPAAVVLLALLAALLLHDYTSNERNRRHLWVQAFVFFVGGALIVYPEIARRLARFVGIGRGVARDVRLLDPLPLGFAWQISPAVQGCSIILGSLSCSFGDMAPKDSVTITVTAPTAFAQCGTRPQRISSATRSPSRVSNTTGTCDCGATLKRCGNGTTRVALKPCTSISGP